MCVVRWCVATLYRGTLPSLNLTTGVLLPAGARGLVLARQVEDVQSMIEGLCTLAMTYLYMGDAVTAMLLVAETDVHRIDKGTIGYEQAICELASGTIFYYQHHYNEASAALSRLE